MVEVGRHAFLRGQWARACGGSSPLLGISLPGDPKILAASNVSPRLTLALRSFGFAYPESWAQIGHTPGNLYRLGLLEDEEVGVQFRDDYGSAQEFRFVARAM